MYGFVFAQNIQCNTALILYSFKSSNMDKKRLGHFEPIKLLFLFNWIEKSKKKIKHTKQSEILKYWILRTLSA